MASRALLSRQVATAAGTLRSPQPSASPSGVARRQTAVAEGAAVGACPPVRVEPAPRRAGLSSAVLVQTAAAAGFCRGLFRGSSREPRRTARNAEGDIDFAVIRFKIPGFDDLTELPRVLAVGGLILLALNRFVLPEPVTTIDTRLSTEIATGVLALLCLFIPYAGGRLEDAARRQVTQRPKSRQPNVLPTLAFENGLPEQALIDLSWTSGVLLQLTNADGLAIYKDGKAVATRGLLQQLPGFSTVGILPALSESWRPTEQVDGFCAARSGMSVFPAGLVPDAVVPGDAEAVIAKPLPGGGQLVMWSAKPRAFDRAADRNWVSIVAVRIGEVLGADLEVDYKSFEEQCFDVGGIAALSQSGESSDPFELFAEQIRVVPGVLGFVALVGLAWNRIALLSTPEGMVRGVDTAQSRVDLIAGVLAMTLVGQSMIWLSEIPVKPEIQDTSEWQGVEEKFGISEAVNAAATAELRWAWQALSECTRVSTAVVFWQGKCVMQGGLFRRRDYAGTTSRSGEPYPPWEPPKMGELCEDVMKKGMGRYLAQLKNYPSKVQFQPYLPELTQGVVITPMKPGKDAPTCGLLVLGVDAIRGVGKVDQAWIGALAEKLAVSLAASLPPER